MAEEENNTNNQSTQIITDRIDSLSSELKILSRVIEFDKKVTEEKLEKIESNNNNNLREESKQNFEKLLQIVTPTINNLNSFLNDNDLEQITKNQNELENILKNIEKNISFIETNTSKQLQKLSSDSDKIIDKINKLFLFLERKNRKETKEKNRDSVTSDPVTGSTVSGQSDTLVTNQADGTKIENRRNRDSVFKRVRRSILASTLGGLAIGGLVSLPSALGVEGPPPNVVPPASLPSLPSRAIGGPVANTGSTYTGGPPYEVGENGPEIFTPNSPTTTPDGKRVNVSYLVGENGREVLAPEVPGRITPIDPSKTDSIINSVNATVDPSTTGESINATVASSTTGRPGDPTVASSTTGESVNATVASSTTGESVNATVPSSITGESVNATVASLTTGRPGDAVSVDMMKQPNLLNGSEQQKTTQNELIPPQNKLIPPQNKPIPPSQQTKIPQYQNGQTQQPESSERRPLISQSPPTQFGLGDIPSQPGNTTVRTKPYQDSFVNLTTHQNPNYPLNNISV
jgi:hypothetical protein